MYVDCLLTYLQTCIKRIRGLLEQKPQDSYTKTESEHVHIHFLREPIRFFRIR